MCPQNWRLSPARLGLGIAREGGLQHGLIALLYWLGRHRGLIALVRGNGLRGPVAVVARCRRLRLLDQVRTVG